MAKSTSKRRPRTSTQSSSRMRRSAKAGGRAAAGRATGSKTTSAAKATRTTKASAPRTSKATSSAKAKRPKTAPKAARPKVAAKAAAAKRRPAPKVAKPKGRKVTAPVISAKKRTVVGRTAPKSPAAPKAAAQALRKPRAPERPALAPSIPSSLDFSTSATAARSGAEEIRSNRAKHTDTSPALTGGDIDASWEEASSTGDEAPGGDNLTPDQDVVEEIGSALGIEYADDEELQGGAELENRDRHRWEYDPASADDYIDRLKNES